VKSLVGLGLLITAACSPATRTFVAAEAGAGGEGGGPESDKAGSSSTLGGSSSSGGSSTPAEPEASDGGMGGSVSEAGEGGQAGEAGGPGGACASTAANRICTAECPCASAEGICTASDQCVGGTSCVSGSGIKVGRVQDTCLADHCNNDRLDPVETSVDCGGECGCLATYEEVSIKNIPNGTYWHEITAISGDAQKMVGYVDTDDRGYYPVSVARDGALTQLPSFSKSSRADAISGDGKVIAGVVICSDPPDCADPTASTIQWSGSAAPKVVFKGGWPRKISSSGASIAGEQYSADDGGDVAFLLTGFSSVFIPEMDAVAGLTPDAKYVVGHLRNNNAEAGVWYAPTQKLTKISSPDWNNIQINAVNGTTPTLVGFGNPPSSQDFVGFRWKDGVFTDLGHLPSGNLVSPTAVSADGATVVGSGGSNDFQAAFIWTEAAGLRSIVDELRARGLELPVDMVLKQASFISDDGKTIIGAELTEQPTFWRVVLD